MRVAVIGAGAAGMIAAGRAARGDTLLTFTRKTALWAKK